MEYIYVEIELDGVITTKRMPVNEIVLDRYGLKSEEGVRKYFERYGYDVGLYVKFL
jgi:hypothetical protein